MSTKSKTQETFGFDDHFRRTVQADFSGGHLSSDGGALFLRQIDRQDGISEAFSQCFLDQRDPRYCDHTLRELLAQRLIALALGYEDLNDHDRLRADPLLALCVGKSDLLGEHRLHDRDKALASSATLNRVEVGTQRQSPYHIRCDSGFCREELFALCDDQLHVYYAVGMARNARWLQELDNAFFEARIKACLCGGKARVFRAFSYRTQDSWSRPRTLIGKAEVLGDKDNPRFVVTHLPVDGWDQPGRFEPQNCYENFYCQRGEAENHVKQQQLDLFATRSSSHWMEANQLRLFFSAFAYLMMERLRTLALQSTQLAVATASTIRTRLLKIAAHVLIRSRRIYIRLASAFPLQDLFRLAARRLPMSRPLIL